MTIQATITPGRVEVSQRRLLALFLLGLLALALAAACATWAYYFGEDWKAYAPAGALGLLGIASALMAGNSSASFDKRTRRVDVCRSFLLGVVRRRSRLRLDEVEAVAVRRTAIRLDQQGRELPLWSASLVLWPSGHAVDLFWSPAAEPVLEHALLLALFLNIPLVRDP